MVRPNFKLGRLPRKFDPRTPHYSALAMSRPRFAPPPKVDWLATCKSNFGMMLNDNLGDCTCAAVYHARQVWSANAHAREWTEPDQRVLELYERACGYSPNDPSTDQGGIVQDVLKYLVTTGAPIEDGHKVDKLTAFVEIDPRNMNDIKQAINDCGLVYIGFSVPESLFLTDNPPSIWDVVPNHTASIGGHAVILPGYDSSINQLDLISWGERYKMTENFFHAFVDEAYALCDPAWIMNTGKTLLGLTPAQLQYQMRYY